MAAAETEQGAVELKFGFLLVPCFIMRWFRTNVNKCINLFC